MHPDRIKTHLQCPKEGHYVLYWMQASQRIHWNYALAFAVERANALQKPLLVYFGLTDAYPEANERHYAFMLEGLEEVASGLKQRKIGWSLILDSPERGIRQLLEEACELIMDKGYLKIQKQWRKNVLEHVASKVPMTVYEVEGDVVVPVETASMKEEYSARTLRPKIWRYADAFLQEPDVGPPHLPFELKLDFVCQRNLNVDSLLNELALDRSVERVSAYKGGASEAEKHLNDFIHHKLKHYLERNHPEFDYMSNLSPYLHFGQIAPAYIVNQIKAYAREHPENQEAVDSFMEELIIRRELAINFVYYNEGYDQFDQMTYPWAYETMKQHIHDIRDYTYDLEMLEQAQTHDVYWNTAMKEMLKTGKMQTYMRMYWCKKILEWSVDYKTAYENALYLNNKYFLDGRDANSYTGIAWCFGKHDRAWKERPIFGKLRYMNSNGLERKFKMEGYMNRLENEMS